MIARRFVILFLAVLGAPALPATTFVVTNINDSGSGSLRQAILNANANPGPDQVHFSIPGGGVHTIAPNGALPPLTDAAGVLLDGYTQPGSTPNTLPTADNAALRIELSGIATVGLGAGLESQSANNVIRGFIVNNFSTGILLTGSSSFNVVAGNFIGTDRTGTASRFNSVGIQAGGSDHRIGGSAPADRNIISGNNGIGVWVLSGQRVAVAGNFVGLQADGSSPLSNTSGGIELQGASDCVVGGATPSERNVISANFGPGVRVIGDFVSPGNAIRGNWIGLTAGGGAAQPNGVGVIVGSFARETRVGGAAAGEGNTIVGHYTAIYLSDTGPGNLIRGNRIGTSPDGTQAMPNWIGISFLRAPDTTIGGAEPGAGNVISGNYENAIVIPDQSDRTVILGNRIGVTATGAPLGNGMNGIVLHSSDNRVGGTAPGEGNVIAYNGLRGVVLPDEPFSETPRNNRIHRNAIHDNGALGIDLLDDGATPNDALDADDGSNALQNYPVIERVTPAPGTIIHGTLNSAPNAVYTLEFFSSPHCDPSGYGEGALFLGAQSVATDGAGTASFAAAVPAALSPSHRVTSTATDSAGNTSEFSACSPLATSFHTLTPCRVTDTRQATGGWGGPALSAGEPRTFPIAGRCGLPATARAVSFNITVTQPTASGHLTIHPAGTGTPLASTLNYSEGQTRANNAVLPLGNDGAISIRSGQPFGSVHVILDVNGYYE